MIKRLLKSVREYKTASVIVPVLMAVEAIMEIVIPFLMTFIVGELQRVAEGVEEQVDINVIAIVSTLMILCAVIALVSGSVGAKLAAKASCGFAHNLREDMYNNLQTFSFANIDNYSTASLITRITTDVTNVQNAYQMAIRMLVRAPILFIASIIMTVVIEPVMALIFAGAALVLGVVVAFCMFRVVPYFRTMFKKYDNLNSVVQENLTAIRVVKSYVREDKEISKMKVATGDVYTYSEVRILDLDAYDSWYLPEFVNNTILFASKTEGMSEYTYIMACDLTSEDGDMMSNAELNAYNEQYEAVSEKIDAYDDETNSDGTAAYEHLSSALTYAFYSGDEEYIDELVQAYIDIAGEDEEYMYSKRSVEIYHEFFSATGDWADYASLSRKVDGQTVYANMQKYYYSLIGKMSESDYDEMIDGLRSSYMQDYPVDDTTWWDSMGLGWQIVFCIAMCVAGLAVIGGVAVLVVWLVRRNKNKKVEGGSARAYVDITDDKNIDVYDGGENE